MNTEYRILRMRRHTLPLLILATAALGCVSGRSGSSTTSGTVEHPKITFSTPSFEKNGVYTALHFEVTNVSNRTLEFIQIHASFYDKDGMLVKSEHPYIESYTALAPGQQSTAEVMTDNDRRITNYKLTFTANGEGAFEKVDLDASEITRSSRKGKK